MTQNNQANELVPTHYDDPEHYNSLENFPDHLVINFYSRREPFGEFSNFAFFPVQIDDVLWPTTEHYYQAHKFMDRKIRDFIRSISDPAEAAKVGRDSTFKVRVDWDMVKDQVMKKALIAKFTQHQNLKKILLLTEEKIIHEHTENDIYWGDGGDGSGKDRLGQMLMEIRNELRK